MTVTPERLRQVGQYYVDHDYSYGFCDRCGGSCREFDCSGLQCKISNETGLTRNLCTTSFVMAQQCSDFGLEMTEGFATSDEGPDVWWAFHGADHGRRDDGSRPNGASGHIVLVVRVRDANGHTTGFYTIEAMGRAYGVVNGAFWNRAWTGHYRIPGVSDRTTIPVDPAVILHWIYLDHWRHDCYAETISFGDRSPKVQTLNDLLEAKHFIRKGTSGNAFGEDTRRGVYNCKRAHPEIGNTDGKNAGGLVADALLKS